MKKLLLYIKLYWMYLTECEYQVVKVTPQNVYRIRKYYKRLPNIRKKYVMNFYRGKINCVYECTKHDKALSEVGILINQYQWEYQKLLDKINEKEIPV